jgi:uncharacterized protein YecE (DUF72 family)
MWHASNSSWLDMDQACGGRLQICIGTAGWNVPRAHTHQCGPAGSHLERYAAAANCVEVNSSFYRPHKLSTWQRWATATPPDFRFAVKAPKAITHERKLVDCGHALQSFFREITGLEHKLGPVLFQLAPRHAFDSGTARDFLVTLRELHPGSVVFEPRHASWFTAEVDRLLREFSIARAAADPPAGSPLAASPAGFANLRYYRLHGSPRTYFSAYDAVYLQTLAAKLNADTAEQIWVIFDNTGGGAALANALELVNKLQT